jgi:predicted nuclease of predicted toxin-antitoxin system
VRALLDEQLPRQLATELTGHEVSTVQEQGWAGLTNGELLRRAADEGFQVLITADQNLEFQQNLSRARLGVIVLVAASNALEDLLPLVPEILAAIPNSRAGQVARVAA